LHNWFIFSISLNIRGADVSIFYSNVRALTGAILLNMTESLATAALNARVRPMEATEEALFAGFWKT
jgi:hypothetical protein